MLFAIGLLFATTAACKNPFADLPPVEDGGVLSFSILETLGDKRGAFVLRLRIKEREPEGFLLVSETPHRTLEVAVDPTLSPIEKDAHVELPLTLSPTPGRIGSLWLPSALRAQGAEGPAGVTRSIVVHKQWKTWSVEGPDGTLRYYEVDTGLLVEFSFVQERITVVGGLVGLR